MENKITLKDGKGKKNVYNILLEVSMDGLNYVMYTNYKIDKTGDCVVYFAKYENSSDVLKNVNKKEEGTLKLILNKFRGKDE